VNPAQPAYMITPKEGYQKYNMASLSNLTTQVKVTAQKDNTAAHSPTTPIHNTVNL